MDEFKVFTTSAQRRYVSLMKPEKTLGGSEKYRLMINANALDDISQIHGAHTHTADSMSASTDGSVWFGAQNSYRPRIHLDGVGESKFLRRWELHKTLAQPIGFGDMTIKLKPYEYHASHGDGVGISILSVYLHTLEDLIF